MGTELFQADSQENVKVTTNALWVKLYGEKSDGTNKAILVNDDGKIQIAT